MSIEDYMTAFDGTAARRSLQFVRMGIRELNEEITHRQHACLQWDVNSDGKEEQNNAAIDDDNLDEFHNSILEEDIPEEELLRRHNLWLQQQKMDQDC